VDIIAPTLQAPKLLLALWSAADHNHPESLNHSHRNRLMKKPPVDPDVADLAPSDAVLTVYDEEHIITYLRMLDADAEGADWREVARIVLHIDPKREHDRARRAFDSHLTRAKWMTEHGYRHLLRGGASNPNL
jgi:Uncharacterized conserved protein (DUF2285)